MWQEILTTVIAVATAPETLRAAGSLASIVIAALSGTTLVQSRANWKTKLLYGVIAKYVAWNWHNYLRDRIDSLKASGAPEPAIERVKQVAHTNVVKGVLNEVRGTPLARLPEIKQALAGDTQAIDAAVVTAVKAFKAGTLHTGPTTKGA